MTRNGSSLVEVLVAMAVGFLLVVGTAELMTLSAAAMRKGDLTAALVGALTARLEAMRSLPFDDGELAPGTYAETVPAGPRAERVALEWRIEDAGEGLKTVRVGARPEARPGPGMSAVLFISRDLGFEP